jgi:hypothetical protein
MTQVEQKSSTCDWWTKSRQLYLPEKKREIRKRIRENEIFLFKGFVEHKDATKLGSILRELIDDTKASWLFAGFQSGFTTAQQLKKHSEKKEERYKVEIARIIKQHRGLSTEKIFAELDEREVQFIRLGRLRKTKIWRWSDVANEPSYKMLVSRIRWDVAQLSYMKNWAWIIKQYEKLYKEHEKIYRE